MDSLIIIIIGIIAGAASGMFGIGGGVIIVPALIFLMNYPLVMASGTSLGALMLPVGIFAVIEYHKKDLIDYKVALIFSLGLLFGVVFGAKAAIELPAQYLRIFYGVFLVWVAYRFWDFKKNNSNDAAEKAAKVNLLKIIPFGLFTGVMSGLFGIGGGLIMVPIMTQIFKFDTKKAVGTSLAALLPPVALPGVYSYYAAGYINIYSVVILAFAMAFGAYFGAKLSISLNAKTIKRIYAIFLIIISLYFLASGIFMFK